MVCIFIFWLIFSEKILIIFFDFSDIFLIPLLELVIQKMFFEIAGVPLQYIPTVRKEYQYKENIALRRQIDNFLIKASRRQIKLR